MSPLKKILFLIDPLEKLYPSLDSSLYLLKEFSARGCETWTADFPDLSCRLGKTWVRASKTSPKSFSLGEDHTKKGHRFEVSPKEILALKEFSLVMLRKEPPFDMNFIYSTFLLELESSGTLMSNHPRGILNTCGEKMGCLKFSKWMPDSLVSCQVDEILEFRQSLKSDLILKPLDMKGGIGIIRISKSVKNPAKAISRMTGNGQTRIMAQEFVGTKGRARDKRLTLLNGELFWAFEKVAASGNFRTNLDQGGTVHPTKPTAKESKLMAEIGLYAKLEGLHVVGLDVIDEKLIDFNITCPGGFAYAIPLHRQSHLIETWADFLENQL